MIDENGNSKWDNNDNNNFIVVVNEIENTQNTIKWNGDIAKIKKIYGSNDQ